LKIWCPVSVRPSCGCGQYCDVVYGPIFTIFGPQLRLSTGLGYNNISNGVWPSSRYPFEIWHTLDDIKKHYRQRLPKLVHNSASAISREKDIRFPKSTSQTSQPINLLSLPVHLCATFLQLAIFTVVNLSRPVTALLHIRLAAICHIDMHLVVFGTSLSTDLVRLILSIFAIIIQI